MLENTGAAGKAGIASNTLAFQRVQSHVAHVIFSPARIGVGFYPRYPRSLFGFMEITCGDRLFLSPQIGGDSGDSHAGINHSAPLSSAPPSHGGHERPARSAPGNRRSGGRGAR